MGILRWPCYCDGQNKSGRQLEDQERDNIKTDLRELEQSQDEVQEQILSGRQAQSEEQRTKTWECRDKEAH